MSVGPLGTLYASGPHKMLWGKPAGARLEVSGRRLDGSSQPLEVEISPHYSTESFNPSEIGFPVPGCWELEARADGSVLSFVVEVLPRTYEPSAGTAGTWRTW